MSIFARLREGIETSSADETQAIARECAAAFTGDVTLALHGNLGVGKTTFVQGLAQGLGITHSITSPTFNIFTLHRGPRHLLLHLDAYRLTDPRQVDDLMLDDFLTSPYCLAVEWPENIGSWIPPDALHFILGITDSLRHHISLR